MWWDKWIIDGLVNLAARIVWILSYPGAHAAERARVELRAARSCWACC